MAYLFPKLLACLQDSEHCSPLRAADWKRDATPSPDFRSRRDNPEAAGDPINIEGEFNRMGGAPGPKREAERLQMPGRHGQYVDPDRPVQPSPRAIEVTKQ